MNEDVCCEVSYAVFQFHHFHQWIRRADLPPHFGFYPSDSQCATALSFANHQQQNPLMTITEHIWKIWKYLYIYVTYICIIIIMVEMLR